MLKAAADRRKVQLSLPVPQNALESVFRGGKWVFTSVGVVGIFASVGFLVDTSGQDFLGYRLQGAGSLLRYLAFFGEFAIDSVSAIVAWIGNHLVLSSIIAMFSAAIRFFTVKYDFAHKLPHPKIRVILVGMALLALIIGWDFPVLGVKDMLITTPSFGSSIPTGTFVGQRTYSLWTHHICSRVSATSYDQLKKEGVICHVPRKKYIEDLRDYYLFDVGCTVLLTAILAALFNKLSKKTPVVETSTQLIEYVWPLVAPIMVIIALLGLAALPYVYARTAQSTYANETLVDISDVIVTPDTASTQKGDTATAPRSDTASARRPDAGTAERLATPAANIAPDTTRAAVTGRLQLDGYLLDQSSDELVLFNSEKDEIWVVPRTGVSVLRVHQKYDVIYAHLRHNLHLAGQGPPPPGTPLHQDDGATGHDQDESSEPPPSAVDATGHRVDL